MSRERAEEIRKSVWDSGGWTTGVATPEEVAEIKAFWERCPGSYSFYDAVATLAREAPAAEVPRCE